MNTAFQAIRSLHTTTSTPPGICRTPAVAPVQRPETHTSMMPQPQRKIRVLILEDQPLFRECLCLSLSRTQKIEVVAQFEDSTGLLASVDALHNVHVGLIDIRLGNGHAFDLVGELSRRQPRLRLIWLTSIAEDFLLEKAFAANLPGFVHKEDSLEVLEAAVCTVASGGRYYSEEVMRLRERSRGKSDRYSLILSEREQEVLRLIGSGFSNTEAASMLSLSADTVKTHRRNIMARLGVHTALELQAYALSIGLVEPAALKTGLKR